MSNNNYFDIALDEAKIAYSKHEIPVGCVIVKDNLVIAKAHNLKETKKSVSAHAEILAINEASKILNNYHLDGCSIYSTLEPCAMCFSAIMQSHIKNVYYILKDNQMGACGSVIDLNNFNFSNPKINLIEVDYRKEEYQKLLKDFFSILRDNKK